MIFPLKCKKFVVFFIFLQKQKCKFTKKKVQFGLFLATPANKFFLYGQKTIKLQEKTRKKVTRKMVKTIYYIYFISYNLFLFNFVSLASQKMLGFFTVYHSFLMTFFLSELYQ